MSFLTQSTADLELLTWIGSKLNYSPEATLRTTANVGYGFSLKDITQFGVIIAQVLMEFGDQQNTTILRAIAGSLLIVSLAGSVTGYITGKVESSTKSKLAPLVGICSFFAAMRLMTYGFNLMTSGLMFLYQSYDRHYGYRTPEQILMDPVLCDVRPQECRGAALRLFNLPPEASSSDVKNAYKKMTEECHPDLSSGDTNCLLRARAAKNVLKMSTFA